MKLNIYWIINILFKIEILIKDLIAFFERLLQMTSFIQDK